MRVLILITTLFLSVYSEWVMSTTIRDLCPYGASNPSTARWFDKYANACQTSWVCTPAGGEPAMFTYVPRSSCASKPEDDTNEGGCNDGSNCDGNNQNCYDSSGRSFEISIFKNCSDYCKGPATEPTYDANGNLIGYEPVNNPTGQASVHLCGGGDDPYGEQLSDDQSEQGYDGEVCGTGQRWNGERCEGVPENCGYLDGKYVCSDSDGNTLQCGNQSGNQASDFCNGGNTDKDDDQGTGGNAGGSNGGSGGSDDGGSGDGSDGSGSGSGGSSGGGSSGGDSVDGSDANDGTGDGIPDGQTEVGSCEGVAKCQCKDVGLGKQQCFAPEAQACKKGYHWDMTFAECMRDDCPEGQFDPHGSPFDNCRPIQCDDGSTPTDAGCPEDMPDAIEEPVPDDDGNMTPDEQTDPDPSEEPEDGEVVDKLGEILEAIKNADTNNNTKLSGISNKLDNVGGGGGAPADDDKEDDEAGDCDPTDKDYLSCIELGNSGDTFDGFSSLEGDIKKAREGYQKKLNEMTEQFKDKIKVTTQSVSSPFYHDYKTVMGAEVDFGTAFLEPFLRYLPALILFLAAVYSAFTILGGYKQ